jgi:hypothetical protein
MISVASSETLYLSDPLEGIQFFYRNFLQEYMSYETFWQHFLCFTRRLKIKADLQEIIDEFVSQYWQPGIVGLHLRRTDHIKMFSKRTSVAPYLSTNEKFFQAIDREITQGTGNFFLATDDWETRKIFESRFVGKTIAYNGQFDTSVFRQTSVQDALIDLYLLSKTRKIVGSYYSSFSEFASYVGNIPLQFA